MENLSDLFVPYELVVKLKEKGFKQTCFGLYDNHKVLHTNKKYVFEDDESNILAPLYQQVIDWFLDKHKIYITEKANELLTHFSCKVWKSEKTGHTAYQQGKWTETYPYGLSRYEALDIAIEEALKLI